MAYPDDASTAAPLALTSPAAETNSEESADTQKTSRHPAGLAIDVAVFRKTDGSTLSVRQHFHGQIGAKTCRPGDGSTGTEETRELHAILCEAAAENVFTYILSPNFNRAHYDHFHMEVKSGVRWTLVH